MYDNLSGVNMLSEHPTHAIIKLSVPIVMGNFLQQIYNVVDAYIVSVFIGANALGSIGSTSSIQFLVLGFCIGCCSGFVIPVAQSFGSKKKQATINFIVNGIFVSTIISLALTVVCMASINNILHLLNTPPELYENAKIYLLTLFFGIPCTFAYNLSANILRACGNSKIPFLYLTYSSLTNIFLDVLFVTMFNLGVQGTAIATIIAQGIAAILCFRRMILYGFFPKKWDISLCNIDICNHLLKMGIPTGLQYSITAIGTIIIQSSNNSLGSIYTTAFYAGSKIRQLFMCPFDGIATGTSVFVSQNLGANNIRRVHQGVKHGVIIGVLYGLIGGAFVYFFAQPFAGVFLSVDNLIIINAAAFYLKIIGVFLWLLGILNILRMCIQGLGYTRLALGSGIVELLSRVILCLYWVPIYKYTAICLNEPTAWGCGATYVSLLYFLLINRMRNRQ